MSIESKSSASKCSGQGRWQHAILLWLTLSSIALLITLLLAACVSMSTQPPDGMPKLEDTGETAMGVCPQIEGRYSDTGTSIDEDGVEIEEVSLIDLLFATRPASELVDPGSSAPPAETPETTVISGLDDGVMQFESFKDSVSVARLRQAKKGMMKHPFGYTCLANILILPNESGAAGGGMATLNSVTLYLRRGIDGSLIIRVACTKAAMIVIVPAWNTTSVWYNFPRLPDSDDAIHDEAPVDAADTGETSLP
jgi:hypothetical protein